VPLEKGLRSTSQGKLNSTSRQQTSQSFREQAIRVWNWPHLDKARWAKKNAQTNAALLPINKVSVIMIYFTFWSLHIQCEPSIFEKVFIWFLGQPVVWSEPNISQIEAWSYSIYAIKNLNLLFFLNFKRKNFTIFFFKNFKN
jgi:hypothetical protein